MIDRKNKKSNLALRWAFACAGVCVCLLMSNCTSPPQEISPLQPPSEPLISDDFLPPNAAWVRFETEENAVYALQGELYLEDRGQALSVYTPLSSQIHADTVIGVQTRHVQGSMNNWMGIICRQQDENNYYLFAISADGYYLILLVENGVSTSLIEPTFSEVINQGKANNYLEARCLGSALSLRVNDTLLVTRADSTLRNPGGIALFADAANSGDTTTVAFDNFVLLTP